MGIPKVELKNAIDKLFNELWGKQFVQYQGARMGKLFYKGPDSSKAREVTNLSRAKLSHFIRIISGHNSLFYFRNKVDPDINSVCRFCLEEEESFFHLATDCPRFWGTRRDYFKDIILTNDHQWSVNDLLAFSYSLGINEALEGDTRIELYRWHEDMEESSSVDDSASQ